MGLCSCCFNPKPKKMKDSEMKKYKKDQKKGKWQFMTQKKIE